MISTRASRIKKKELKRPETKIGHGLENREFWFSGLGAPAALLCVQIKL